MKKIEVLKEKLQKSLNENKEILDKKEIEELNEAIQDMKQIQWKKKHKLANSGEEKSR